MHALRYVRTLKHFTRNVACAVALASMPVGVVHAQNAAPKDKASVIARGEYLARASDCIACHTMPAGKLFAGTRPMDTPFGTLYTPNITPDKSTGIGAWSADDFYRMLHEGKSKDGTILYPAMPYASYTRMTREDSDAMYAYLMSVPAVHQPNRPHTLRFPFNKRELLLGWRTLYFRQGEYKADPTQSVEWNRGAYLVEGPGHCAMCHTAINALGGSSASKAFEGGLIPMQNWYAPSLTSNREAGLGDWSIEEISDLLQTGVSKRGAVYGPMAEVVYDSLQYLSDEDIRAMAVYLKSLPARSGQSAGTPTAAVTEEKNRLYPLGKKIYDAQCAVCHGVDGKGKVPHFPPLAQNQSILMTSAVNPVRMVLNGGYPPGTTKNPSPYGMPPFAHTLSDEEVAAVVTYIRTAWGNNGTPISGKEANELRTAPLY
ncbi:Alcohol dehydrogenase (quinone), cytochrome c subunit [Paraburkholderia saeva]|uniref:Alcohol dehydrogenase (Quinone), cytochrome c subunit n=2 Tax=Paraburkholderia saeva TaxID=2777537 RepID=A0A9N8S1G3_9BURK|nr:Alcohol dehydrogenase (quinone), cytochrome c subunit [Paraburkholderia saeva]CAG4894504.1 Alcohol dehydrogenase (quinone), cytochrome c subunit [Paraburkholderia saeva]CAG4917617.1 Alcohol dehydrogenase (quinone), cytochrome c subunit [Paraburkholderia saeva]